METQTIIYIVWAVVLVLAAVFYKVLLRVVLGIVIVPQDKLGLVTKKFVLVGSNKSLPDGRIIAINGEAGYQAKTLAPGLYYGMWAWQYQVVLESLVKFTFTATEPPKEPV